MYVFNRFKVKPADKKYSSVKADYQIDFMDKWVLVRNGCANAHLACYQAPLIPSGPGLTPQPPCLWAYHVPCR